MLVGAPSLRLSRKPTHNQFPEKINRMKAQSCLINKVDKIKTHGNENCVLSQFVQKDIQGFSKLVVDS